jgi:pimeloyl-ACP methyl ester carboxylesterase
VSRDGRPDLAGRALPGVKAPTLLIVGSDDEPVIGMNREAMRLMSAPVELEIIPGATHLFEEPGRPEQVMELASEDASPATADRLIDAIIDRFELLAEQARMGRRGAGAPS